MDFRLRELSPFEMVAGRTLAGASAAAAVPESNLGTVGSCLFRIHRFSFSFQLAGKRFYATILSRYALAKR